MKQNRNACGMKIIQIMPEFGFGGAEIMCENLTYELKKAGHEVVVLSMYDYRSAINERMENGGVDVRYLGKKSGLDFSMIAKMYKIFKKEKPDAIHTHRYVMQYAVPAAIMAGVRRRVHTLHSVASMENGRLARKLNRIFYRYFGVIPVALSENVRDTVIEEYGLEKDKISVIYNGVPLDRCIKKTDYTISRDRVEILHVGRYTLAKNHKKLIDAVLRLHENDGRVRLKLIGDGELKEQVAEYIRSLGAQEYIEMYGTTDNVYPHFSKADIFVLPSVYEGMPMTLIEAMGSAMPIVASDVGGIHDMLTDGETGLLCTSEAESIYSKLLELISDERLRKYCGENAFTASGSFSAETMGEKYEHLYR